MITLPIHDPCIYAECIKQFIEQSVTKNKLYQLHQQQISLFNFGFDKGRLSKILAKEVQQQTYKLSPPRIRKIITGNKPRDVYDYNLTDKIVIKVFTQFLNDLYKPLISKDVYSFQKGITTGHAIQKFSQFIKTQRKDSGLQGIYLLKTDIKSYTDTIYLGHDSTIWSRLSALLNHQVDSYVFNLMQQMIRPAYYNKQNRLQTNWYGIPTGSPISSFLYNFYCAPLDAHLGQHPGGFYARYGDDILLAHSSGEELQCMKEILCTEVEKLRLRLNPDKLTECYFSPAGNKDGHSHYGGKNAFDYLGYRIDGYGHFTLSEKRKRSFLRAIFNRIKHTHRLLRAQKVDAKVMSSLLCETVNRAYTDKNFLEKEVKLLIYSSNDHGQLKHLDYLIALAIAKCVTGLNGPRAFSKLPYKKLRTEYKLSSLVNLRNGKK